MTNRDVEVRSERLLRVAVERAVENRAHDVADEGRSVERDRTG